MFLSAYSSSATCFRNWFPGLLALSAWTPQGGGNEERQDRIKFSEIYENNV
jgi:hypothetical protein